MPPLRIQLPAKGLPPGGSVWWPRCLETWHPYGRPGLRFSLLALALHLENKLSNGRSLSPSFCLCAFPTISLGPRSQRYNPGEGGTQDQARGSVPPSCLPSKALPSPAIFLGEFALMNMMECSLEKACNLFRIVTNRE